MRIYREEKVNPLGGCLPIVVQMPFFIALYWVLLSTVEMRDAPWIGWIHDLSARDPYFILPAADDADTLLQTWLNPTPPDPVQAKMMWIMPLVFSVMFFFFPAGLVLYWLTNNILSIAQQWLINAQATAAAPASASSRRRGAVAPERHGGPRDRPTLAHARHDRRSDSHRRHRHRDRGRGAVGIVRVSGRDARRR